jgi:hypothetical protein
MKLSLTLALILAATSANAQVCGDVNGSGTVSASDAMIVLQDAVGLDTGITCGAAPVRTCGTSVVVDAESKLIGAYISGSPQTGDLKVAFLGTGLTGSVNTPWYLGGEVTVGNRGHLYFESHGCVGPAILSPGGYADSTWNPRATLHNVDGGVLYRAGAAVPSSTKVYSTWDGNGGCIDFAYGSTSPYFYVAVPFEGDLGPYAAGPVSIIDLGAN